MIGHTLWVTAHHDDERWPGGDYPTQSDATRRTGMTTWIADDAPLVNTDVVLWYVFGIHHITRLEDWPIMPVDTISFWLKPFGFFDQNPSLDVAPSMNAEGESCHSDADGHSGRPAQGLMAGPVDGEGSLEPVGRHLPGVLTTDLVDQRVRLGGRHTPVRAIGSSA